MQKTHSLSLSLIFIFALLEQDVLTSALQTSQCSLNVLITGNTMAGIWSTHETNLNKNKMLDGQLVAPGVTTQRKGVCGRWKDDRKLCPSDVEDLSRTCG